MAADRPSGGRSLPIGLMVVGSEMAGFTVVGVILDFALGTLPWFTIGLTVFGFVVAFALLIRIAKGMTNPTPNPPSNGSER